MHSTILYSPEAKESWGKLTAAINSIIKNSQDMAAQIFKAGMQIQIVNTSMETMESYLGDPDPRKALETLSLNENECTTMIGLAKEAGDIMEKVHV